MRRLQKLKLLSSSRRQNTIHPARGSTIMAKAPVLLWISASTFKLVVMLMVLAFPGRGESEGDANVKTLQHVGTAVSVSDLKENAHHEVPEHVEFMLKVPVGHIKVPAGQCSQSNGNLLSLLLPCAGAVRDPRSRPSSSCCQGVQAVTDGCVCYLEAFIDGNPVGLTFDDVSRIATDCGRNIVKC